MKRNFSRDELISIRNSLVSLANNHDFGVFVDYLLDYCTMRVFMPGRVDTEEVMAYRALYNVTKAVLDDYRNHTGIMANEIKNLAKMIDKENRNG